MAANASAPQKPARRNRTILKVLLVLGAAWLVWSVAIRDNVRPKNFGVIEPGAVYRSAALTPAAIARLHDEYKIKTIVDLGGFDKEPENDAREAHTAEALGIQRIVLPLEGDGTGNPNAYVQALRIMADPTRQPVLVHCSAGAQRTGAAAKLYGQIVQNADEAKLAKDLRTFGHDPRRNTRLAPFLADWTDKIRVAFRGNTTIEGFPSMTPVAPPPPPARASDPRDKK